MNVTIRGATLAGLASAARLARLGHDVTLITDAAPLGGRWAPEADGPGGHVVDALPQVVTLPAAWRDLFKKSGAHLQTELNRAGLDLSPAPAPVHRFANHEALSLPSERGAQFKTVEDRFGESALASWRALLDGLEGVWQAYRRHALEGTKPTSRADRRELWLDRSLLDLADGLGPVLGRVVADLSNDPRGPGLLALPLYVEQTFGRWQLIDDVGRGQRTSRLVELLTDRLVERGVRIIPESSGDTDLDCRPSLPKGGWLRHSPAPAPAPRVTHTLGEGDRDGDVHEFVDHSGPLVRITWTRPVADATLATTHDHSHASPDPGWGAATASARDWLARAPIVTDGQIRASACSPAGPAPWAELGSAALAVYELHERLTGQDSRPTNRNFQPPRSH